MFSKHLKYVAIGYPVKKLTSRLGQSVDIRHLGKYLRKSKDRYLGMLKETISNEIELKKAVDLLLIKELQSGVQTIQYQINTLMTTNGRLLPL